MPTMNGKANLDNNLWFATAITALYAGLISLIQANHWMVIPDGFLAATSTPVFAIAAHLWDWKTGDNK